MHQFTLSQKRLAVFALLIFGFLALGFLLLTHTNAKPHASHKEGHMCPRDMNEYYACFPPIQPVPFPPRHHHTTLQPFPTPRPKLRIALLSYLTPEFVSKYRVMMSQRNCYALRHGYSNFIELYPLQQDRHIHYNKIRVLMKYLPYVDYLVYIDGDHWISRPEKPIQHFVERFPEKDVFFNMAHFMECPLDAGSLIVKNTERAHAFLEHWLRLSDEVMVGRKDYGDLGKSPPHNEFVNYDNGLLHHAILSFLRTHAHATFGSYADECRAPLVSFDAYNTIFHDPKTPLNLRACMDKYLGPLGYPENSQAIPHFHFWPLGQWAQYAMDQRPSQVDFLTHGKTLTHTLDGGNQVYCTISRADLKRQWEIYKAHPEWTTVPYEIAGFEPRGDEATLCGAEEDRDPKVLTCPPDSPYQLPTPAAPH